MACRKCRRIKNQICRVSNIGFFDVEKALKIILKSNIKAKIIGKNKLEDLLRSQHISVTDFHLKHINKKVPIIIGQIPDFYFILDGNHRALYNYLHKKPTYAFILTEFETGRIFQEVPPKGHRYVS